MMALDVCRDLENSLLSPYSSAKIAQYPIQLPALKLHKLRSFEIYINRRQVRLLVLLVSNPITKLGSNAKTTEI